MHLDARAVELPLDRRAARSPPAPRRREAALAASIGCTGRSTSRPTSASAASPPVSARRAVSARSPLSIAARRTAAAGTSAARGDRVGHQPGERALAQLAGEEAHDEVGLGRRRAREQLAEHRLARRRRSRAGRRRDRGRARRRARRPSRGRRRRAASAASRAADERRPADADATLARLAGQQARRRSRSRRARTRASSVARARRSSPCAIASRRPRPTCRRRRASSTPVRVRSAPWNIDASAAAASKSVCCPSVRGSRSATSSASTPRWNVSTPRTGGRATSSTTPSRTRAASRRRIMGEAIAKLGWARHSYVISTKVFWGLHDEPNMKNTLNRKYLMQAIDGSLERLGLDFVDLLFCHRADPNTPIEETVWAMSDIVVERQGALLGHVGVDGRRDPRRVGDRRAPPPAQAGDGAAAVQPVCTARGRAGVRPALRGHRARPHDLEPARVGPAHRQVPRRHARRQSRARSPGYEWLPGMLTDPRRNEKVRALAVDRRRSRLHARAALARVVHEEPARVDGDHRREQGVAGAREHGRARGRQAASTTT